MTVRITCTCGRSLPCPVHPTRPEDQTSPMRHRVVQKREHDTHQHGDLVITTERRSDGTIVVRIDPGAEQLEVHHYAKGTLVR